MNKIISILNHKGGTAKTTSTLNIGKALSILGHKILLIDLDAQANLTQSLGIDEDVETIANALVGNDGKLPINTISNCLDIVPASLELSALEPGLYSSFNSYFKLKSLIDPIKENYSYILIDCPPSLGIFTQNALIASEGVIITLQAQYLSLKGLDTVYNLIGSVKEKLNPALIIEGLLVTQTNHTNLGKEILATLRKSYNNKVYHTTIRQNVALAEASIYRKDIFSYDAKSFGAIDYMNLTKEIIQ